MRTSVAVAKVLENQGMGKEPLLVDPFNDILSNQTGMVTVLSIDGPGGQASSPLLFQRTYS